MNTVENKTPRSTRPVLEEKLTSLDHYLTSREAYEMWKADPDRAESAVHQDGQRWSSGSRRRLEVLKEEWQRRSRSKLPQGGGLEVEGTRLG